MLVVLRANSWVPVHPAGIVPATVVVFCIFIVPSEAVLMVTGMLPNAVDNAVVVELLITPIVLVLEVVRVFVLPAVWAIVYEIAEAVVLVPKVNEPETSARLGSALIADSVTVVVAGVLLNAGLFIVPAIVGLE